MVHTDAEAIVASTPEGVNIGAPIGDELAAQLAAYEAVGFYGEVGAPPIDGRYDESLVDGLYDDDGNVIWPAG